MAIADQIEWQLLDTDLTTVLGIIPASESQLYLQLDEPGSGTLKMPLDCETASWITTGQFARASYRGAVRGGFFIENISRDSGEAETRMMTISGRGILAVLDDAIVWDNGSFDSTRTLSDVTMAGAMITLIDEAQARGCFPDLAYDFTALLDTDGSSWVDSQSLDLTVGKSLLAVERDFADNGIDFDISLETDGTYTLHAYLAQGSDKSATVYMRTGQNCEELSSEELGGEIKNAIRLKYSRGYTYVSDATSITNYRRRETLQNEESAGNSASARTFGQSSLAFKKDPTGMITVKVYDGTGPRIFTDYELGDTITLDNRGTETGYRIRAAGLAWSNGDLAEVALDLNSTVRENEMRMALEIQNFRELWTRLTDSKLPITSFWSALALPSDDITRIHAFAISGNTLYVGGEFAKIGDIVTDNVAVLDLTTGVWSALGSGLGGVCYALGLQGGNLYASTGAADDYIQMWDGAAWNSLGAGLDGLCNAIVVVGTDVYVGGAFSNAGAGAAAKVAVWDTVGTSWSALGAGLNGSCYGLAADGATIYATGDFTTAGGGGANYVAKWNGAAWSALGVGLNAIGFDCQILNSELYVVGGFTQAGGSGANYVAKWTGTAWEALGSGFDSFGQGALAISETDIYVTGNFTTAGGVSASKIARWDGGGWTALGSGSVKFRRL